VDQDEEEKWFRQKKSKNVDERNLDVLWLEEQGFLYEANAYMETTWRLLCWCSRSGNYKEVRFGQGAGG
jgi:hypothetical protein